MHTAPALARTHYTPSLRGLGAGTTSTYSPLISSAGQVASAIQSGNMQAVTLSVLGAAGTAVSVIGASAGAGAGAAAAAGTAGATTAAAGTLAVAVPIIGAAIAGVMIGLTLLFNRKGPRQKVATTQIVDAVEPKLKENVDAYLALPVHYESAQKAALANFDAGWAYVVSQCNIPEMGDPGVRCTSDRQSGACVWRDAQGECWNWFKGYRDPIANDPNVVPDPPVDSVTGEIVGENGGLTIGGVTLSNNTMLIAAGGLLVLALSMGGDGGRR